MDIILAPDVYVNASVALGSPPERVVQRVLGKHKGETRTTPWILERVASMLAAHPDFKEDAVRAQIKTIREHVEMIQDEGDFGAEDWQPALVAAAKAAGASRVITDHPDLLEQESVDGIEMMSTEAWLLEQGMPPPPPTS